MTKQTEIPPLVFGDFVETSNEVFRFLVTDHGFEYRGWEVNGRECVTWYHHVPNVTLMFSYEPLSAPFGSVFGRLKPDEPKMVELPFFRLARLRIPGWRHPNLQPGNAEMALTAELQVYADLLRDTFPEILEAPDGIGKQLRAGFKDPDHGHPGST